MGVRVGCGGRVAVNKGYDRNGAFKIHLGDYVFWIFFIFLKKYEFWRRAKALEISRGRLASPNARFFTWPASRLLLKTLFFAYIQVSLNTSLGELAKKRCQPGINTTHAKWDRNGEVKVRRTRILLPPLPLLGEKMLQPQGQRRLFSDFR